MTDNRELRAEDEARPANYSALHQQRACDCPEVMPRIFFAGHPLKDDLLPARLLQANAMRFCEAYPIVRQALLQACENNFTRARGKVNDPANAPRREGSGIHHGGEGVIETGLEIMIH